MSRDAATVGHPLSGTLGMYTALAAAEFRRYATYRQALFAAMFTNSVFGFLRCFVLLAVVAGAGSTARGPAGYSSQRLATYVWIGQGLLGTINIWSPPELAERIRSGEVVADLLRPVDPIWQYLAADLGRAGYAALTRFVVPVVVGALAFDLYVPLTFLPAWAQAVLYVATPFPYLLQVPLDVLVERGVTGVTLAGQVAWAVVMLTLARRVQRRAERRLVIQGG